MEEKLYIVEDWDDCRNDLSLYKGKDLKDVLCKFFEWNIDEVKDLKGKELIDKVLEVKQEFILKVYVIDSEKVELEMVMSLNDFSDREFIKIDGKEIERSE